ncbi:26S proteasome non-ATPase regulatory subunit 10 [Schistosoma japonicum]|nr:26S proteasome non-ATPase regulatory subunit 10 [Schistosoma japonicum]
MTSDLYISNIRLEYQKLQSRVENLEKEKEILAAELGHKEHSFCGNILSFVESLFLNTKYSDVLIKTPNVLIPGHKFVLDARGGVWNIYTENGVEYINMQGYCQDVCDALILWTYRGVLESHEGQCLSDLMTLAREYCLPSLFSQCEIALIPLVTRENCLSLYSSSYRVRATRLLNHCFIFLSDLWPDFSPKEISTVPASVLHSFLVKYSKFPVHLAIDLGRDDAVLSLLNVNHAEAKLLVNQLNEDGLSPLYMALKVAHFELAEKLIDLGAEVNALIGPADQRQPVTQFAFTKKRYDAVQFLLLHGSYYDFSDSISSRTLLHNLAIIDGNEFSEAVTNIAKTLIKQSVNTSCQDADGNSPLHLSILYNNSTLFDLLLNQSKKLDLDLPNNQGLCPLWFALVRQFNFCDISDPSVYGFELNSCTNNSYDFASQLIENGANVNYRFTDIHYSELNNKSLNNPLPGDTLLLATSRMGWESAALFLLDQVQCDPTLESFTQGETVFHVAVEAELSNLCNRLIMRNDTDPNRLRFSKLSIITSNDEISYESTSVNEINQSTVNKSLNPFDYDCDDNGDCTVPFNLVDDISRQLNTSHVSSNHIVNDPTISTSLNAFKDHSKVTQLFYCSPLHLAVQHKMFGILEFYLEDKVADVDWLLLNESGDSVLSLLLWSEQFQLVDQILESICGQSKNASVSHESDKVIRSIRNILPSKCNIFSLLIQSIERDQLEVVKFLVEHGADINENERNSQSYTNPLWTALTLKRWAIADYLVNHGTDVNSWGPFNETNAKITLLHRSIHENNEEAGVFLVNRNCDVNACAQFDHSTDMKESNCHIPELARYPLHMATLNGMYELVKVLICSNRVHINQQDYNGETALHLAIKSKNEKLANLLIEAPQIDYSIRDSQGYTVFHVAVDSRQRTIAQNLLKKDHSLALQVDSAGRNFLHVAIENLDREAIFLLIQIGVDMNACVRDVHRLTPFHLAIKTGVDEDILRSLLLAGASINSQTPQKQYGLHLAVIYNRPELVHCLLENGADANAQDSERNTPLHLAIRHAKVDCLVKLLNHSSTNCYCINMSGQLPIHLLAQHHGPVSVEMLQYLLEISVANQINAQDAAGNTP